VEKLEDQAPITLVSGDPLAVKILKQRNGILSGEPGKLFEATDIYQAAAKLRDLG
jgi:hypothetical protein